MTDVFNIQLPDGRTVGIQANSPEEAAQGAKNIMMREGRSDQGTAGGIDNLGRSIARGVPFIGGLADEFAAGADATVGPYVDWLLKQGNLGTTNTSTAPTWNERYTQNLGGERAQDKAYDTAYPVTSTAGKIGGGVAGTLAAVPQVLASAGGSGLMGALRAAGAGGLYGGGAGFGEGEGGFLNRAENAGLGAGIGALTGGALNPIANIANSGVRYGLESGPGRYLADKTGQAVNMMADVVDRFAPKVAPGSLSAAAPEGTAVAADSALTRVADALRSAAPDSSEEVLKNAAARRIGDAITRGGNDVPGFKLKMGELGPGAMPVDTNPMTQRLARTAYISPGGAPAVLNEALDARNLGAPSRFRASLGPEADVPPIAQAREFLDLNRQMVGKNVYGAMDEAGLKQTPALMNIYENPQVSAVMTNVMNAEKASRAGTDRPPASPVEIMHEVKRGIQNLGLDPTGRPAPGAFWWQQMSDDFVRELRKANPKLAEADDAYRQATSLFTARDPQAGILTKGQKFMGGGTSEAGIEASPAALAADLPKYDPMQMQTFKVGATNTMKDTAADPDATRALGKKILTNDLMREKLPLIYGPDRFAAMEQAAKSEKVFSGTDRVVRGGSDTASKLLSATDDALSGGIPMTPQGWASKLIHAGVDLYNRGKAGNEAVREQIARMLTQSGADANEELITRIAAQLSMEAKRPRVIQRAVIPGVPGQE